MTKAELLHHLKNIPDNTVVNVWVPTELLKNLPPGIDPHDDFVGFPINSIDNEVAPAGIIISAEEAPEQECRLHDEYNQHRTN